jgi:hypothetical protein
MKARLGRRREARQRVSIERFSLPCRLVPCPILIADDLDRHDDAVAAELIGGGDAIVEFSVSAGRELDRARQVILPKHLEFVIARIRAEQIERPKHVP